MSETCCEFHPPTSCSPVSCPQCGELGKPVKRLTLKEPDDPVAPVCYCFGWTPEKIQAEIKATGKSTVAEQIKAQVKAGNCTCEVTNPQGSCCLGNVSAIVKAMLTLK